MALDRVESLQDTIKRFYNKEVRNWFGDVSDETEDLTIPRHYLRYMCLHEEPDSLIETMLRIMLFEMAAKHAASLQPEMYGLPIADWDSEVRYKPQIKLFFLEPIQEVTGMNPQVQGEITFRLFNKSSDNLTNTDLLQYATALNAAFATPPYRWRKGKSKFTYKDVEHGYDLRILARTEADARELIDKLLGIQNQTFKAECFAKHLVENEAAAFPENPGTQRILNETRRKFRRRPNADVLFRYASIHVHGLPNPINLVDVSGVRSNPVLDRF